MSLDNRNGIISIVFREHFDIYEVHSLVVEMLGKVQMKKVYLRNKRKYYLDLITTKTTYVEKQTLNKQIADINREIGALPTDKKGYNEEALNIFGIFDLIPQTKLRKTDSNYSPTQDDIERIECIEKYFELAKKYINLTYVCTGYNAVIPQTQCGNCEYDLSLLPVQKDNIIECPSCGVEKYLTVPVNTGPKIKDVDLITKETSSAMKKLLDEYNGKIVIKEDISEVISRLDAYFSSKKIPTSKSAKLLPLLPSGKKRGTSANDMRTALKFCKYSFYNATRYLCKLIWGWKFENIDHLEISIINDAIDLEIGYQKVPPKMKDRKASISKQASLYFLLRNRGVSVDISDFKIPKDKDNCNRLLSLACKYCDNKEIVFKDI